MDESRLDEPTDPMKAQPAPGGEGYEDEVNLADIVRFVRRNWLLIFGMAFLAAAVTALGVYFLVPHTYEAAATLVVVPPTFAPELKPPTLTIQGYQKLLESDAVLHEAKRRLVEEGLLEPDETLRIGGNVETRIFVSRRAEHTALAPMVEAIARSSEPAVAAAVANTWAEVFIEEIQKLVAGTTSATVRFIERQYPEARERLMALERERLTTAEEFRQRVEGATDRWDRTILAFNNETEMLLAETHAEHRRASEALRADTELETRREQIRALRESYSGLQREEAGITAQLQRRRLEHEAAERQLAATEPIFELRKAMTDEALWQMLAAQDGRGGRGSADGIDWAALQGRALVSQELNPVFVDLTKRAAELEMEVGALAPRREQLRTGLGEIRAELLEIDRELGALEADLERLVREQAASLAELREERAVGLATLERRKELELETIRQQMETRLLQLSRDIEQSTELHASLARSYNQANLAEAQQDFEDVRLGAAAVAPERPAGRGVALKGAVALLLGGFLGLGAAAVREVSP